MGLYNEAGTMEQENSYDAWGKRRIVETWNSNVSFNTDNFLTVRGYTSHEHLDKVNLINMPACRTLGRNGRLYSLSRYFIGNPLTARMLSPDPFVQNASSTQNYNRYSYCMNNPLKYTDPSGYSIKSFFKRIFGSLMGKEHTGENELSPLTIDNDNSYTDWGIDADGNQVNLGGETKNWLDELSPEDYYNLPESLWQGVLDAANGKATLGISGDGIHFWYSWNKEKEALNLLWDLSHDKNGNFIQESMAVFSKSNGIGIMYGCGYVNGVFYSNDLSSCDYSAAWLDANVKDGKILGTDIDIFATIHTHPWDEGLPPGEIWDHGPSVGDKTLYRFGNFYVLDRKNLYLGYRSSQNSNVVYDTIGTNYFLLNGNLSLYTYNLLIPYYPFPKN